MKVVAIIGPTAVGKTDIALSIASNLNGEIINMDSIQIYKGLDIGSAKPSLEEQGNIPHHLLDFVDPFYNYSVSDYQKDAKRVIKDIFKRGTLPVLTGGTGLYLNSLYYKMDFNQAKQDLEYRYFLEKSAEENGPLYLHDLLKEKDLKSANEIHPNNVKRVIRALEINYLTGLTKKSVKTHLEQNSEYDIILIGLNMNRQKLYARINYRVELMLKNGLVEEVQKLKNIGLNDNYNAMKGIGYKEVLTYLDNRCDYETMAKMIKQNSRHYAKRQLTWFKRYNDITWFDVDDYSEKEILAGKIKEKIVSRLQTR
jgi:tRNA dimethylallyltransferase